MPFGAALAENGEAEFRLWAPAAARVDLRTEARGERATMAMPRCENGWRSIRVPRAPAGTLYQFVVDGGLAVPDPASRFQPRDVHGPSELIDPAAFDWPDAGWRGRPWHETVLYELHVGAFTPEGSYAGAAKKLDHLAALGVTAIELMPVAEAPGMRNWGYDGVLPFAPEHRYGRPDELKRLVAAAHARNIQVFLDVVFNHFGPEGNYLGRYAPQFFLSDRPTPWGAAIDFEGPGSRTVRDFFIHNALYWIEEFHIDGLRLDAVHAIFDKSQPHILEEIAEAVRGAESPERHVHLVLENDDNAAHYLAREPDGRPRHYAAQWSEDIHHALHHLVTGETAGHYGDFADAPVARLGRALAEGFAYQGERSRHRGGRRRGEPSAHLPPTAFVSFLQNHDMVGNRAFSERITATAPAAAVRGRRHGAARAVSAAAVHGRGMGRAAAFSVLLRFRARSRQRRARRPAARDGAPAGIRRRRGALDRSRLGDELRGGEARLVAPRLAAAPRVARFLPRAARDPRARDRAAPGRPRARARRALGACRAGAGGALALGAGFAAACGAGAHARRRRRHRNQAARAPAVRDRARICRRAAAA
jgi:malto-oligosyltrehalose trehalohydrolase